MGISVDMPESNAVVLGGMAHLKSDAVVAVLSLLPSWGAARVLGWMPRRLRDGFTTGWRAPATGYLAAPRPAWSRRPAWPGGCCTRRHRNAGAGLTRAPS